MQLSVSILHVLLCIFLILIILLQPGKEGAAAFGGGGSNQSYGPRGKAHLLSRATTIVAALFMFTSITLAWWSTESVRSGSDIEDDIQRLEEEAAEAEKSSIDWGALGQPTEDEAPGTDALEPESTPAEDPLAPTEGEAAATDAPAEPAEQPGAP